MPARIPAQVRWSLWFLGVIFADWSCGHPHVNPVSSFVMLAARELTLPQALMNMSGQILGACAASHGAGLR